MHRLLSLLSLSFLTLSLACAPKATDDDNDATATETPTSTATPTTTLPPAPNPFTLTVSGASETRQLLFEDGQCYEYAGSPDFRQQWSGTTHVFVLRLEVVGSYNGPGVYDQTLGANVKLQEQAGGSGGFFQASPTNNATMDLVYEDDTLAWGSMTVSALDGTWGSSPDTVTISPQPIPIYCPNIVH